MLEEPLVIMCETMSWPDARHLKSKCGSQLTSLIMLAPPIRALPIWNLLNLWGLLSSHTSKHSLTMGYSGTLHIIPLVLRDCAVLAIFMLNVKFKENHFFENFLYYKLIYDNYMWHNILSKCLTLDLTGLPLILFIVSFI